MKRIPKKLVIDGVLYEAAYQDANGYDQPVWRKMTSRDFRQFDDIAPSDLGDSYICEFEKSELHNHEGDVDVVLAELIDSNYPDEGGPIGIRVYLGSKVWERSYADDYRRAWLDFKNITKWILNAGLRSTIKEFKLRSV